MAEPFIFKVNLGGMIDILANHLYSSPDVFVRELLQNGTDAISARKLIQPDFSQGCIKIQIQNQKNLSFSDNGTGLNSSVFSCYRAVFQAGFTDRKNFRRLYRTLWNWNAVLFHGNK